MWELTAAESCACPFGWEVPWPGVQDSTGLNSAPRQCMLCREYQRNADTCPGGLVYHWQSADACQQEQHLAWNPEDTEERSCSWHTAATEVSGGLTCSELGHVAFCRIWNMSCMVQQFRNSVFFYFFIYQFEDIIYLPPCRPKWLCHDDVTQLVKFHIYEICRFITIYRTYQWIILLPTWIWRHTILLRSTLILSSSLPQEHPSYLFPSCFLNNTSYRCFIFPHMLHVSLFEELDIHSASTEF